MGYAWGRVEVARDCCCRQFDGYSFEQAGFANYVGSYYKGVRDFSGLSPSTGRRGTTEVVGQIWSEFS